MKKYLFIGLVAILATSCEKDPDLSKLDNNFTVYTNYDSKTNFNDFKAYCLPDSILLVGQGMKAEYWKDDNAQKIIKQVAEHRTATLLYTPDYPNNRNRRMVWWRLV